MPLKRWIESANNAIEGILFAAKTQRHLRYHFYAAIFVLILSFILGIKKVDFLIVSIAVIIVLLAEMLNTAIEFLVDMVSPEYNEKARWVKDIAAGAVLITAFGAAVLGYFILSPYIVKVFEEGISISKHSKNEVAVVSIIIVLIFVIILKSYFGKGHPLRGGMPSGHSAVAFSMWVALTYITGNMLVSLIAFLMALLIARSRVSIGAHSWSEVIAGSLLGAILSFLLFLFFSM
jgi:diacylglycerol kinase (ATP)